MKNRIIALVVGSTLLLFYSLFAQAPDTLWTGTYGGSSYDVGIKVQQTTDGGYIVVGWTNSFGAGEHDVYLIKTNGNGDTLWTRTYGGINRDEGLSVQQTSDNGYIIAGHTESFGAQFVDIYVIRTNILGDTIWTKIYNGDSIDFASSIQETSDGGFIITGGTTSFGANDFDVYLMKIDINGDTLWTQKYGGIYGEIGNSIQQTSDGGFIIAGCIYYGMNCEIYIIKTDSLGDSLWAKTLGGIYWDEGWSIQQTIGGEYIIAGWTDSFGSGWEDIYLIKLDENGDTLWTKTFGGVDSDEGYSVEKTSDGGYIIAGESWSFGNGAADFYLIRTNISGDTLWTKTFGGASSDYGRSVEQTLDGGYIITGRTLSFGAGEFDVYLVKTEPDPTSIDEKPDFIPLSTELKFIVSPNPFTTVTSIQLLGNHEGNETNLTIYHASGRLMKSVILETSTYQLGTDLKAGIYFLKLNGKPVGKVVKVK